MRARRDGDTVRIDLEAFERELLTQLRDGLKQLLENPDRDDPAVQRLFPVAVPDDEEADAELRRLIYDDLLRDRLDALDELVTILDRGEKHRAGRLRVVLHDDEPALMLGVLNDLRLTLGSRIGIEHLDRDEVDAEHPAARSLAIMDHLAWLQELLLRAFDPPSVDGLNQASG